MSFQLSMDLPPIARQSDPYTSKLAADEITASGTRQVQLMQVLEAARQFPGKTSAELGRAMNSDRFLPARRLPELRALWLVVNGEARQCGVTGKKSLT